MKKVILREFEIVENPHTIKVRTVETKIEGSEEVELEKFVQCVDVFTQLQKEI